MGIAEQVCNSAGKSQSNGKKTGHKSPRNGHQDDNNEGPPDIWTAIIASCTLLVSLFVSVVRTSFRVTGAAAYSTFVVLKCAVVADCVILAQVVGLWVLFGAQIFTTLRFVASVIVFRIVCVVAEIEDFLVFLEDKWTSAQQGGSEPSGLEPGQTPPRKGQRGGKPQRQSPGSAGPSDQ